MTLRIFEKHPDVDAYRVGGAYQPYAIVAVDNRFTDSELAAEHWKADSDCQLAWIDGEHTSEMQDQFETILRFATLPNFDD